MKALGDIISSSDGLLSRITWCRNWYMNVHIDELLYACLCWTTMMLYDVAIRDEYDIIILWSRCYCCRCRWCRTLLLIKLLSPCILIKVGGLCPVNVNHSKHVDLRAYALHVDLGVDVPHVALRAIALHVELRACALTRWFVPHAYCIVKLLLCRCIVVNVELSSLLSCCRWFKC